MTERLFVYGTLHPDRAPEEIASLVGRFKRVARGTVRGHLYDLSDYPAVVLDPKGPIVTGEVLLIPSEPGAMARLDAYEEYTPNAPAKSLFLRRKARVTLEDGSHAQCWIYVYNKPIPADQLRSQLASVA